MNRLHKKCVVGSAGIHILLLAILFVGPGFLSPSTTVHDVPAIDFIPSKLVDAAVAGGGNPNAGALAARPPSPPVTVPEVKPPSEPVREKVPPKELAKPEPRKPDSESLEVSTQKKRTPKISTQLISRAPDRSAAKAAEEAAAKAREQQLAQVHRLAGKLSKAAENIREGTSSATTIEEYGPGGGGPAYASYAAYVKMVYENSWIAPEDSATDDAVTKAKIVISRDGTVILARISKASGDGQVDASVQRTLDKIKFIAPFPEGVKDKERTYFINFNLKAKRGLA